MGLFSFYRISRPSREKVAPESVQDEYRTLRNRTFWGAASAYGLYYVCRMSLSVVKQPLIDGGVLSASELGIVGSAMFFVYAVGKFVNGFIGDYCNIRRFMATGIFVSSILNLVLGIVGLMHKFMFVPSFVVFMCFVLLWGVNGWMQSMGAPPGVISLSRWFPQSKRGTFYGIFSATPYAGKFLSLIILGAVASAFGWQYAFIVASAFGFVATFIIFFSVSDTPESRGLPSIQELSGEQLTVEDSMKTVRLQRSVLMHPGIWVIAVSSAFIYITRYAVDGWGVLFLQKMKHFSLNDASQIIAISSIFGILGTVLAGWLSDRVFRGDRIIPAVLSGISGTFSLGLFLFGRGGYILNILYVSLFFLSIGVLYCIVAGLMAVDIVPRKATGAALGIVGISSYFAAGFQDILSGILIDGNKVLAGQEEIYDFGPVSVFWMLAAFVSFILPVLNWKKMKHIN